jgi:hypothetical protein
MWRIWLSYGPGTFHKGLESPHNRSQRAGQSNVHIGPEKASFPRKALLADSKAAGLFVFLHLHLNPLIHEPDKSMLNRPG